MAIRVMTCPVSLTQKTPLSTLMRDTNRRSRPRIQRSAAALMWRRVVVFTCAQNLSFAFKSLTLSGVMARVGTGPLATGITLNEDLPRREASSVRSLSR